jgi:hypothetical protein
MFDAIRLQLIMFDASRLQLNRQVTTDMIFS